MSEAPEVLINIGGEIRRALDVNPPQDRAFRSAWQFNGAAVAVDMAKATEVQRDRLRAERAAQFNALDAEWFRADEAGDAAKKAEIAARKKALRDVTAHPKLAKAKTPDELKACTLSALVG